MMTILFFVIGGGLAISSCIAYDQYKFNQYLIKKYNLYEELKQENDRDNNEDIRS